MRKREIERRTGTDKRMRFGDISIPKITPKMKKEMLQQLKLVRSSINEIKNIMLDIPFGPLTRNYLGGAFPGINDELNLLKEELSYNPNEISMKNISHRTNTLSSALSMIKMCVISKENLQEEAVSGVREKIEDAQKQIDSIRMGIILM